MFKILFGLVLVLSLAGIASADLVGYWKLDGDGLDSSGYDNHGTINGNVEPAMDRFGNPSGAMSFAGGGGDNIDVGDDASLNITGAMTITAWVYLDSTSPVHGNRNGRILGKMDGGGQRSWSTGIEMNIDGVPLTTTLQVSPDGSGVKSFHEAVRISLPTDQWVHYAGVYTPGTSMEVYLNGDSIGIETTGVPASQYSANGHSVLIGNRPACGNCGWYGSHDEVRIYNEALSQSQILGIMWGVAATNPDPANGADRVPVNPILSWDPPNPLGLADPNHPEDVQYVVYFDPNELLVTDGDPSVSFGPQFETEFSPGPGDLELVTTYYWRVDVIDPNFGGPLIYPGVVWKFTTLPPKAGVIFPENGAVDVAQDAILQWDPGFGAIEHDVYFGTDQTLVTEGDASVYMGRQSDAFFDPNLDWETEYFWRIDEIFASGGEPEQGDVWSFTTGAAVCEYELEGDVDNNCVVNLEDLARMAANWLVCNLTNGDCP